MSTASMNPGSALSQQEQRQITRQLTLALVATGALILGLLWRWLAPAQVAVADILLGCASLIVGVPILRHAYHSLRHASLHGITDQLIALALLGAWATGDLLTAAVLPLIMVVGHILEERSVMGSQEAIEALAKLTRSRARRVDADGTWHDIDNHQLVTGDVVEVRAGDKVPADGRVLEGEASLDTASITGESVPQQVVPGMEVYGGAINLDGRLRIEVTRTGETSTLGRVIALMQSAEQASPPITRLLERHAARYLILVLMIAASTWFLTQNTQAMLAVLVAACPCALVLSAPATSVAGLTVAARHGILIRGAAFLEELAELNAVIIDKTGTLTHGKLHLQQLVVQPGQSPEVLRALAASLGATSNHPVSRALVDIAPQVDWPVLENVREHQGLGVCASTIHGDVVLGRRELLEKHVAGLPQAPVHDGPIVGLVLKGCFLGWLLLSDTLRVEAASAMAQLRELGLKKQLLLTGDREEVAQRIAQHVGIHEITAGALPADKLHQVKVQIDNGFRPMVIGDGINDSLALKAGVVGVAMGASGSDIAMSSADIVLIGSDLRRLGTCVRLSRLCRRTLQMNVLIGLGWTLVIVAAAAFGWLGASGAVVAAILHNLSTLLVLGNAGRLLRFEEKLPAEG